MKTNQTNSHTSLTNPSISQQRKVPQQICNSRVCRKKKRNILETTGISLPFIVADSAVLGFGRFFGYRIGFGVVGLGDGDDPADWSDFPCRGPAGGDFSHQGEPAITDATERDAIREEQHEKSRCDHGRPDDLDGGEPFLL